jgi:N-acetyl-gamma-glutamylphosphate reductase
VLGWCRGQNILFCEVADGIHAYGVASHRHAPEIEQGLTRAAKSDVIINFTPHLMPMSRYGRVSLFWHPNDLVLYTLFVPE